MGGGSGEAALKKGEKYIVLAFTGPGRVCTCSVLGYWDLYLQRTPGSNEKADNRDHL